jgi:hypothetical protein
VPLGSSGGAGLEIDLNVKVRDLRDIRPKRCEMKNSRKIFSVGPEGAYSACERAVWGLVVK